MTSKNDSMAIFKKLSHGAPRADTVKAGTLVKDPVEQNAVKNAICFFVKHKNKFYNVRYNTQVPEDCEIVRDTNGKLILVSAVAGG